MMIKIDHVVTGKCLAVLSGCAAWITADIEFQIFPFPNIRGGDFKVSWRRIDCVFNIYMIM